MKQNQIIEFLRKKDFKFIKKLSNGAFGETVLLKDEYLNLDFVCKKYNPLDGISKEEYYKNFVEEIRLLHLMYHRNIVRIFNYYLYPEYFTGYIMMEYIEGQAIDLYLQSHPENINNIFEQVVKGFAYLEENTILHRDIRPTNILVDIHHNVKVIDFGFGKKINLVGDNEKSISINWWGDEEPEDFKQKVYDIQTEIFFIGKLFHGILSSMNVSFKYKSILKTMIEIKPMNRINSFQSILKEMNESSSIYDLFNEEEKYIYKNFAEHFSNALSERESNTKLIMDVDDVIQKFELLQKRTLLEDFVAPSHILRCLLKGSYKYYSYENSYFSTQNIANFINLFKSSSVEKKNIILYNLSTRFEDIKIYHELIDDEIPF